MLLHTLDAYQYMVVVVCGVWVCVGGGGGSGYLLLAKDWQVCLSALKLVLLLDLPHIP